MDDDEILHRINKLVEDEHRLRSSPTGLGEDDKRRLQSLEESLDQCWDLLRQRQARRSAGLDPEDAHPRGVEVVEHYRQ
ncbi:MAG: DUF2630 family protein [Acidimicrobiales bacterium]